MFKKNIPCEEIQGHYWNYNVPHTIWDSVFMSLVNSLDDDYINDGGLSYFVATLWQLDLTNWNEYL